MSFKYCEYCKRELAHDDFCRCPGAQKHSADLAARLGAFRMRDDHCPSPARGAEVTVTDEMVERALVGYHGEAHWTTGLHPWEIDTYRKDMRAAILAALTPPPAKGEE